VLFSKIFINFKMSHGGVLKGAEIPKWGYDVAGAKIIGTQISLPTLNRMRDLLHCWASHFMRIPLLAGLILNLVTSAHVWWL
jgi:hypothetical protein